MTAEKPEGINDVADMLEDIKNYATALKAENDQREKEEQQKNKAINEEFEECIKEITDIVNSQELRYILGQSGCWLHFPDISSSRESSNTYRLTSSGLVNIYSDCAGEKDIYTETSIDDPVSTDYFRNKWRYAPLHVNLTYVSNIEERIREIMSKNKNKEN